MPLFEKFIVNQAIAFAVPVVAGYLKPYLTVGAEKLVCSELRTFTAKIPADDVRGFADTAVAALAKAWDV